MILFVDHYDSFTNNLISWFEAKRVELKIVKFDELDSIPSFEGIKGIIYSPGPGHPSEYQTSLDFYKKIPPQIPFLGVCLGHQLLLYAEGASIHQISKKPIHGRQIHIFHTNQSNYFKESELIGTFVLYNSLGCKTDDPIFSKNMVDLASDNGFILATEHHTYPRIGVQFHPESFASPGGNSILNTFLRLVLC
jgi:anthranilate synthase/aminodeoxychorismate synthase-like glutamine amidotransferase